MTLGHGYIPGLCGTSTSPTGGGSQLVDLQSAVNTAVETLQEIRDEVRSDPQVNEEDYTEILERLDALIEQGQQPQPLPEDYSQLLTNIRNLLGDIAIAIPDRFGDLALEVRGNIDRVVQRFIEQETADERRHDEMKALLNQKLSVKRVKKVTRNKLIDAREFKVTVNLPEGAVAWKIYPMCVANGNLVQDVAHSFIINGEVYKPGELAGDEAVSVGSQIGTLESQQFEMLAGSGLFRIVWSYLSNLPIGDVTMLIDDGTPSTEVIDEGELVDNDGESIDDNDSDAPSSDDNAPEDDGASGETATGGGNPEDDDPNFA